MIDFKTPERDRFNKKLVSSVKAGIIDEDVAFDIGKHVGEIVKESIHNCFEISAAEFEKFADETLELQRRELKLYLQIGTIIGFLIGVIVTAGLMSLFT